VRNKIITTPCRHGASRVSASGIARNAHAHEHGALKMWHGVGVMTAIKKASGSMAAAKPSISAEICVMNMTVARAPSSAHIVINM